MIIMTLVAPTAAAWLELLFNKTASGKWEEVSLLNIKFSQKQRKKV
jgi:hypothetical protein